MRQPSLGSVLFTSPRLAIAPCLVALIAAALLPVSPAAGQKKYEPDHPEVQRMITDALVFIENNQSNLIGNRVMYGMAAYKAQVSAAAGNPKEHPLIELAIAAIKEKCTSTKLEGSQDFQKMYASALACVFLLELDAEKYRSEIEVLIDHIYLRQQDSGAWGYREYPTAGDTSQMQYIALALWLAKQEGFKIDPEVCKVALEWMIDTQQADGGWLYQQPIGIVPQVAGFGRVVRHSLVAAGLGTVYLYADLLQLVGGRGSGKLGPRRANEDLDLPPDVIDITNIEDFDADGDKRRALVSFDTASLYRTMGSGNRWFDKNFAAEVEEYNLYYLYGFERYAAMREYVDGDVKGVEDWYDRGVEHLLDLQAADGSISAPGAADVAVSVQTAFGILFLTRSMSITLGDRATSILNGGKGFTQNAILQDRGDKIVAGAVNRSIGQLFDLLENPDEDEWELYLASLDDLQLDGDKVSRSRQLATLRLLVMHEQARARLLAVKFLGKQRSLDNVPAFIYALSDPEEEIAIAANEALQYVSRKTSGPDISEKPSRSEINALTRQWTEWYFKVQPDGVLLETGEEDDDQN